MTILWIIERLLVKPTEGTLTDVVISETEAQFFKFDHFPTMEEIQDAAAAYVATQEVTSAPAE